MARLVPMAHNYEAAAIAGLRPAELAALKNSLRRVYANMKSRRQATAAPDRVSKRSRVRRAAAAAE